ncbi:MAG: tetratricopeptide repeat protein, partial [Acidobacteria bacterium]|nr:tetratricopeptide repeat protein [Acidobacteriota bacterium]
MRHGISNLQKYRRLLLFGAVTLLLTLVAGSMRGLISGNHYTGVSAQELNKLNRFIQSSNSQDEAIKIFKQGRDQIENDNWSGAEKTFNSFITNYPKHKDVDAALYWKAFALKNQKKYAEADSNLDRLFREYPSSNWIDEAKAMRLEIDGQTGRQGGIVEVLKPGSQSGGQSPSEIEIKMIALQSLFQSNPERAAEFAAAMLKPDSTSDRRLKEIAISLLGQHRVPNTTALLIEIARNQPDPKLRKTAIFWVGQGGSDAAVDALMKLYDTEQNADLKKQILFSLSQNNNPRARAKLSEIASSSGSSIELR